MNNFRTGQHVRVLETGARGFITYISPEDIAFVQTETAFGTIRVDGFSFNELERVLGPQNVCECGAAKLFHPGHSSWCPMGESL